MHLFSRKNHLNINWSARNFAIHLPKRNSFAKTKFICRNSFRIFSSRTHDDFQAIVTDHSGLGIYAPNSNPTSPVSIFVFFFVFQILLRLYTDCAWFWLAVVLLSFCSEYGALWWIWNEWVSVYIVQILCQMILFSYVPHFVQIS